MSEKILEVRQLATSFHTERGWQQAIDGVSFDVYQGEILGIVGPFSETPTDFMP